MQLEVSLLIVRPQVAADLWPIEDTHLPKNSPQDTETREESEVSIEEQINAEVIAIKRPKSDQKFGEWQGGSVNLLDHKSQQRVVRPILPAVSSFLLMTSKYISHDFSGVHIVQISC